MVACQVPLSMEFFRQEYWSGLAFPSSGNLPNPGIDQCMNVKSESEVAQLCPALSDPMDCSLLGSSIHGIFQARVLEWIAISFSRGSSQPSSSIHGIFQVRILEWVGIPFSRGSSQPRDGTLVAHIVGRYFTI